MKKIPDFTSFEIETAQTTVNENLVAKWESRWAMPYQRIGNFPPDTNSK